MARKKKEEPVIEIKDGGEVKSSKWTEETFSAFIEKYKSLNPVRYERVKDELEKQLSELN